MRTLSMSLLPYTNCCTVVQQYGGDGDADGNVAVIVCNVVVGNMYPVIETPDGPHSLNGKPPVPKYDCHGVIIKNGPCIPCPPETWTQSGVTTFSELVIFDSACILPRCVLCVKQRTH